MKICVTCGTPFPRKTDVTYAQWAKAAYCSRACQSSGHRAEGEAHPNWTGGAVTKVCEVCALSFTARRYRRVTARFCSPACKVIAQDHGISTENEKIRRGSRYRAWWLAVFTRDDFTCQSCGVRGGGLHADHIQPFAFFPALRFDVANGRTLCVECHRDTPTFGPRARRCRPSDDVVAVTKGF